MQVSVFIRIRINEVPLNDIKTLAPVNIQGILKMFSMLLSSSRLRQVLRNWTASTPSRGRVGSW